jgi:M6 family metalloprotease-like protein
VSARRHAERSRGSVWRGRGLIATLSLVVLLAAGIAPVGAQSPVLDPIDSQLWVDQGVLTWDDYLPVPDSHPEFYDFSVDGSENQYRTAMILVDYSDQPFLISTPPGSHPFGNPQPGWTPVQRSGVNQWMKDYFTVPNQYNGGKTLHGYWMEDSHGRIGVDVEVFGPYLMPGKQFEYGLATDFNGAVGNQANSICPAGHTCNRNIRNDGLAAFQAATGCASLAACGFNNGFYVTAGHDESSTWQEFGEMLWTDRNLVPPEFGPPGATSGTVLNNAGNPIPNWAQTRYVPWTSWRAAANHWPNAGGGTSTQAESSGQSVYAHEFSHLRGLPDNYNNPFADNQRNFTGYWEMMSRGTFNGPGGTHNRWQIPNAGGSGLGPHHMLHFKNSLGVIEANEQVTVQRDDLASEGAAVVRVKARESVPEGDISGVTVNWGAATITGQILSPTPMTLSPAYFTSSLFLNGRLEAAVVNAGNGSTAEFAAIDAAGKIAFMRREATGGLTPAQKVANAAAAGAAAAVVYNNTTGTFTATVGESIPAFSLSQAQGDAVIALVNAGPVTMELVGRGGDLAGSCARQGLDSFYCPGTGYLAYRLEVVDRVGNDSFAPGHGILLSKSRNSGTPTVWMIDPNPQDIGMIDFYRPDGTPVAVVRGDPRQLNDASFHAGTDSDSEYEYVDNANRLHLYVINKFRNGDGVLYYDLGVRRLDGAGGFTRGVDLGAAVKSTSQPDSVASCTFPLTNTGQAGAGIFDSDIYRLSATSSNGDWEIDLPNALASAKAGGTTEVEVHATKATGTGGTTLSLTATSETDPAKTDTATCALSAADGAPVHRRATAGGQLVLNSSIGTYAGDDGTRLFTNLDVRSTGSGGDDPHGTIEFEFTSGGKTYRLESDDITSLRVALEESSDRSCRGIRPSQAPVNWCTGTADIQATATLFDNSKQPQVAVLEDLRLEVSISDRRTPGGVDTIAVTAWDGNKQVFSSSWSGFAAVEQALASGTTRVQ